MAITQTNVVSGLINVVNTPTVTVGSGITTVASGLNVNVGNFPSTSISGNVVNISGQSVQASVSGNVVITVPLAMGSPSVNWQYINTGFVIPQNTSGGVSISGQIPPRSSGLQILVFYPISGSTPPQIMYGTSGNLYIGSTITTQPASIFIGNINVITPNNGIMTNAFSNIFPFTDPSQINILSTVSGGQLVYGGFL